MKRTITLFALLGSFAAYSASPLEEIVGTNEVYIASEIDASFSTIDYVNKIAGGASIEYFVYGSETSSVSGYYKALIDPTSNGTVTNTFSGVTNNQYIASSITEAGNPGITLLRSGVYSIHAHFSFTDRSNPLAAATLTPEFYIYDSNGVFKAEITSGSPTTLTYQDTDEIDAHITVTNDTSILVTDRVSIRWKVGGIGAYTVEIESLTEGNTASRFEIQTSLGNFPTRADVTAEINTNIFASIVIGTASSNTVLSWNPAEDAQALEITTPDGGTVTVNGEIYRMWKNIDSVTISNGQPVCLVGGNGRVATIKLADADDPERNKMVGVYTATNSLAPDAIGRITHFGIVHDMPLETYMIGGVVSEGDALYLSTTAGMYDTNAPAYPALPILAGRCIYSQSPANIYDIEVCARPDFTWEILDSVFAMDADISALPPLTNTQIVSTNALTLGLVDAYDIFIFTNACTVTIPTNAVVDWESVSYTPIFYFRSETTETISFAAGPTLNDPQGIISAVSTNGDAWATAYRTTNYWDVY